MHVDGLDADVKRFGDCGVTAQKGALLQNFQLARGQVERIDLLPRRPLRRDFTIFSIRPMAAWAAAARNAR